jgi:phosphoglycerate dehydrogenase-like enzyme
MDPIGINDLSRALGARALSSHTDDSASPADAGSALVEVAVATTDRGAHGLAGWGPLPSLLSDQGRPRFGAGTLRDVPVLWKRADLSTSGVYRALEALPDLEWLHTDTAGVDDLPLGLLRESGVTVTKTTAYTQPVAEWIVTAVLLAAKQVPAYSRMSDRKAWRTGKVTGRLVAGAEVAIIGRGEIAKRAAAYLRSLDMRVRLVGRHGSIVDTVAGANYLVVTCPKTTATERLVNRGVLERLAPGAVLVNVGRGGVVCQTSVLEALDARQLSYAVLDVFDKEPLSVDNPLWRDDVLVLPHETWRARGTTRRQVDDFARQLDNYVAGGVGALDRVVDYAKGY